MSIVHIIIACVIIAFGAYIRQGAVRRSKRNRLLAQPIKPEYKEIIKQNIPLYKHLPDELRGKARKRRKSVLRKYGATNPAEFFAVATETFLEKPKQMKRKHPELYEEFKNYYKLDPVQWM